MSKRGPRRSIVSAVRVGDYGDTSWVVELSCGHRVTRSRKPNIETDRVSCRLCINEDVSTVVELYDTSVIESDDPLDSLKTQAAISSYFKVPLDSVQVGFGMATIYLDSMQIRDITKK